VSAADDLHERIFGFRPAKAGTAYERLAAVVLASLGWTSVRHQTRVRPEGRRTEQQLDIAAVHPDGSVRTLLVECKDWRKVVKKDTLDVLVSIRGQAGFDAAMAITTARFSQGAIDVAVDEDVAMVILRPFTPEDKGRFVRRVEINIDYLFPSFGSFEFDLVDAGSVSESALTFSLSDDDQLLRLDGSLAEPLREIFKANSGSVSDGPGEFSRHAEFREVRMVVSQDGTQVPIRGLKWIETVVKAPQVIVVEGKGDPVLVVEQLDEKGKPDSARLVVDKDLYAWEIGPDGSVEQRGRLAVSD
jgi:hypothetical protein